IFPVTAPSGARNWMTVDELATTDASGIVKAPIFTVGAPVEACRFAPVIVTTVLLPATTLIGLNPAIVGETLKMPGLVPVRASFVTRIAPVRAPAGTLVFTCVTATGIAGDATLPPNV